MLTVVAGPPCSGKTTYIAENAEPGDVVIDFDALAVAFGSTDSHLHNEVVAAVTVAARRSAIRVAILHHHRGARVWIVQTILWPHTRAEFAAAGARFVELSAPRAVLYERATEREGGHDRVDHYFATLRRG